MHILNSDILKLSLSHEYSFILNIILDLDSSIHPNGLK